MLGEKVHLRALMTPYNLSAIVIYHKTYLEGLKWVQKEGLKEPGAAACGGFESKLTKLYKAMGTKAKWKRKLK